MFSKTNDSNKPPSREGLNPMNNPCEHAHGTAVYMRTKTDR